MNIELSTTTVNDRITVTAHFCGQEVGVYEFVIVDEKVKAVKKTGVFFCTPLSGLYINKVLRPLYPKTPIAITGVRKSP